MTKLEIEARTFVLSIQMNDEIKFDAAKKLAIMIIDAKIDGMINIIGCERNMWTENQSLEIKYLEMFKNAIEKL